MKNNYATIWIAGIIIFVFIFLQQIIGLDLAWEVGTFSITFFTSMVAHGSTAHLLGNLFALVVFGLILESVIGTKRYIYLLIIAGVLGNLAGLPFYNKVLGISGAIYGIIGALSVLRPKLVVWTYGMPMPMMFMGFIYFGVSAVGWLGNTTTGHLAHLAGIIAGFALGFYWRKYFSEKPKRKIKEDNRVLDSQLDVWERMFMR